MSSCLSCLHWYTYEKGSDEADRPTPMLRHDMAPCALGEPWNYLPQRHPACSRYQALPAAGQAKRARWIADAKLQCYRK